MNANKAREMVKKEEESKLEVKMRLKEEAKGDIKGFFKQRRYQREIKNIEKLIKKEISLGEREVQYNELGDSYEDNWLLAYRIENHFIKLGYEVSIIDFKYRPTFASGVVERISMLIEW